MMLSAWPVITRCQTNGRCSSSLHINAFADADDAGETHRSGAIKSLAGMVADGPSAPVAEIRLLAAVTRRDNCAGTTS